MDLLLRRTRILVRQPSHECKSRYNESKCSLVGLTASDVDCRYPITYDNKRFYTNLRLDLAIYSTLLVYRLILVSYLLVSRNTLCCTSTIKPKC